MGRYINPSNEAKERWLTENGKKMQTPEFLDESTGDYAVCLLDNGKYSSAVIAFNKEQFHIFSKSDGSTRDQGLKTWYRVPREKADVVSNPA